MTLGRLAHPWRGVKSSDEQQATSYELELRAAEFGTLRFEFGAPRAEFRAYRGMGTPARVRADRTRPRSCSLPIPLAASASAFLVAGPMAGLRLIATSDSARS